VTKRKAMWGPKAMGAKVLVSTFKNAGTQASYGTSSMPGPP